MPHMRMYLSKLTYHPGKRQIIAEFSNAAERTSRRYSFFPKLVFPLGKIPVPVFSEALSNHDSKRFRAEFFEKKAVITASTFEDLKAINNLLGSFFGFYSCLIEPERQFLLENKWSYFDAFDFSGGGFTRAFSQDFPDCCLDFIADPLRKTISDLLVSDDSLGLSTVKSVVHSNLLRIPLAEREPNALSEEIFLENVLFASGLPIPLRGKKFFTKSRLFHGKSEFDFARFSMVMSARPFNNLGFESINCDCCRPVSVDSPNVLQSSMAKIVFLREAFYFNSSSPSWAGHLHESMPFREKREKRMREYGFAVPEAGPFARGTEVSVPLRDAIFLEKNCEARIVSFDSPKWVCSKESSLSMAVNELSEKSVLFKNACTKGCESAVASKGVLFSQVLKNDPDFVFRKVFSEEASFFLSRIFCLLTHKESRFFDIGLASSLESVFDGVKTDFEGFAKQEFGMRVSFDSTRAFVDSQAVGAFSRRFSEFYRVNPLFLSAKNV